MAIPKEVRQQMINLMYLVLTALLALNVSREVLLAFSKINNGLHNTNMAIVSKNQTIYAAFNEKLSNDPNNPEVKKYKEQAEEIGRISNELVKYVDELRNQLIEEAKGKEMGEDGEEHLVMMDNIEIPTILFVKGPDKKEGNRDAAGYTLQDKINETRTAMLEVLEEEDRAEFESSLTLSAKDPEKGEKDWVYTSFYNVPCAAAEAILTKIESDARGAESQIIDYLIKQIGKTDIKFDQFAAKIVAPSSYVLRGEKFEAELFLSASSSKSDNVKIFANGVELKPDNTGVALYNGNTSQVGEKTIAGYIEVRNPETDQVERFDFEPYKYTVAAPFAVVNASKMNVFYIGVDNPVEVSAAGVPASKLVVNMDNGTITGGGGNYTVRVSQQGEANVRVSADGKSYGSFPFRVKRIPDPVAQVAGKAGGNIAAGELRVQQGVRAVLENFDFDAKFSVLSYDMVFAARRQDLAVSKGNGPVFNEVMKGYLNRAKPGDLIYLENIRVRGPDGQTRSIPGITFKVT